MKIATIIGAIALTLAVTACGSDAPEVVPSSEPVRTETTAGSSLDEDMHMRVLNLAWDQMSASEQENICELWGMAPDMIRREMQEIHDGVLSDDTVGEFFDGEC